MFLKIAFLIASIVAAASADGSNSPFSLGDTDGNGDAKCDAKYVPITSLEDCQAAHTELYPSTSIVVDNILYPEGCNLISEPSGDGFGDWVSFNRVGIFFVEWLPGEFIICKLDEPVPIPSTGPSAGPSMGPSVESTDETTVEPSTGPSAGPSMKPSEVLSNSPSDVPSKEPSDVPSATGISMETKKGKSKVFATPAQVVTTGTAVDSETTAKLKFSFDKGFTKMEYQVIVTDDYNIMKIDLRCGSAGTNGGVAARMWEYDSPLDNPKEEDNLVSQDVQDMVCDRKPLNTIASLYQAIRNGSIYLSIHSIVYQDGVVRGQIFL